MRFFSRWPTEHGSLMVMPAAPRSRHQPDHAELHRLNRPPLRWWDTPRHHRKCAGCHPVQSTRANPSSPHRACHTRRSLRHHVPEYPRQASSQDPRLLPWSQPHHPAYARSLRALTFGHARLLPGCCPRAARHDHAMSPTFPRPGAERWGAGAVTVLLLGQALVLLQAGSPYDHVGHHVLRLR